MADYYPLMAGAVSRLERNTADARHVLFERARMIPLDQLRSRQPPATELEIMRERLALEDAIQKVKSDWAAAAGGLAGGDAVQSSPAQCPPAGPAVDLASCGRPRHVGGGKLALTPRRPPCFSPALRAKKLVLTTPTDTNFGQTQKRRMLIVAYWAYASW
jgi:hypothetical protein